MNFALKRELRKQRFLNLAEKNHKLSEQLHDTPEQRALRDMAGEPIKVGHHSERRHRRLIEKAGNQMRKSIEAGKKAKYYEDRAASIENSRVIYSDNEDAIAKLEDKLKRLEEQQEVMKATNKEFRRCRGDINKMNITEEQKTAIREAKTRNDKFNNGRIEFVPFPTYALQNNNARIKSTKNRLEELKRKSMDTSKEVQMDSIKIIDNVEENRVQIIFPEKPSKNIRDLLNSRGFHWSRHNGAWQRIRSDGSMYWAKEICKRAKEEERE